MYITDNSRILSREELSTPEEITNEIPLDKESSKLIFGARRSISQILHRQDDRLIVVVGPCSIHDPKAALEYATLLKVLHILKQLLDHVLSRAQQRLLTCHPAYAIFG